MVIQDLTNAKWTFAQVETSTRNALFTCFEDGECQPILSSIERSAQLVDDAPRNRSIQVNLRESQHKLMFMQLDCSAYIGVCLFEANILCLFIISPHQLCGTRNNTNMFHWNACRVNNMISINQSKLHHTW